MFDFSNVNVVCWELGITFIVPSVLNSMQNLVRDTNH